MYVSGWGRTGTNTLQSALEILGFGPCHHMFEVIVLGAPEAENRSRLSKWAEGRFQKCYKNHGKIFRNSKSLRRK